MTKVAAQAFERRTFGGLGDLAFALTRGMCTSKREVSSHRTDPSNGKRQMNAEYELAKQRGQKHANSANDGDGCDLGGAWSSYWYNRLIYETNITEGLNIFRFTGSETAGALRPNDLNPQTQEFSLP